MTTQTEMFPMTQLDIAKAFLEHFETEVEKTTKAMFNAQAKVAEALKLREMAEHEVTRHAGESVAQGAADIVNSGALDTEGVTVTASVSPAVDPITGEVTSIPVAGPWDWKCPTCRGDGRLPDKTGGGHHKCKVCDGTGHQDPSCDNCTTSDCNLKQQAGSSTMGCGGRSWLHGEMMGEPNAAVVALYPDDGDPHETQVGDRTRYGELVADYLTVASLHDEHVEDWEVRALRELTQDGGGYRSLHDVIAPADYGQELLVVALEQGSVTGAPAEKVAS